MVIKISNQFILELWLCVFMISVLSRLLQLKYTCFITGFLCESCFHKTSFRLLKHKICSTLIFPFALSYNKQRKQSLVLRDNYSTRSNDSTLLLKLIVISMFTQLQI